MCVGSACISIPTHTHTHWRATILQLQTTWPASCNPHSTSSYYNLKISFAATSHNSWFHHLQPQLGDTRAWLSCFQPQSITSSGVANPQHNLYSHHKISNITDHKLWLPNQVEIIRTSHNSHIHTSYQYHQATTRDRHIFTLHFVPQLKECHSEPQLKECSNNFHAQGIIQSIIDHAPTKWNNPMCPVLSSDAA